MRRHRYKLLLQRRFDSASLIQARARGMAQRKRYNELLRRREAASIVLRRHWRGYVVGWLIIFCIDKLFVGSCLAFSLAHWFYG